MTTYAYCHRCKKQHRRGTKVWKDHAESLGMYVSHPSRKTPGQKYFEMKGR
jgi:hypothetical protein